MSTVVQNCTSSDTWFASRALRSIGIAPLALLSSLVPAGIAGAKPSVEPRGMDGMGLQQSRIPQYQTPSGGQYHGREAGIRRISAWNLGSSRQGVELTTPIATDVISPSLRFHSAISNTNTQDSLGFRTSRWIGSRNDRSIGYRIGTVLCSRATCYAELKTQADPVRYQGPAVSSRNPRLMLQIGGVLGLVYLAFLAAWIWATRFRIRPPRSAAT